jgi:hypothetical protein
LVRDPEVAGGERAKVLDFGIAKLVGVASGVKTQTATMMGTPMYMSPEQCRGAGEVDQRSDVYSLGCVLFKLATGRPPFVAEGVGELIVKHITEEPPAPSSIYPGIPAAFDRLVLRCLAKNAAERFASGSELALEIGAMLGSLPNAPTLYPRAATPVPAQTLTTLSGGAMVTEAPQTKPRSRLFGVVLGFVVVAGGAAAFMALRSGDDKPDVVTSAPLAPITPKPAPPPAPKPADPRDQLPARTKALFARFTAWAHAHGGSPCPDAAALGDAPDPWGRPYRITCADQPGDQIIGAISAGPDGTFGTDDDVASWQLAREVTDEVRGPRWMPAPQIAHDKKPAPATNHATPAPGKSKTTPSKPLQVDENGMLISR